MIQITLNGESHVVRDAITVDDLLIDLGLQNKRIAVELNLEIIPRSAFANARLKPDDKIEIVHAIGGG